MRDRDLIGVEGARFVHADRLNKTVRTNRLVPPVRGTEAGRGDGSPRLSVSIESDPASRDPGKSNKARVGAAPLVAPID